jgi:H+-translocating NAD(P) transhydrogenase subunit alpha
MSTQTELANMATELSARAAELADFARRAAEATAPVAQVVEPFMLMLTIFLMACFVGYYVVWSVTPALHSPLMGVTNAISSVIVVGGILAAAAAESGTARLFGVLAVTLASVNIVGGFLVTRRMLSMFQKKKG